MWLKLGKNLFSPQKDGIHAPREGGKEGSGKKKNTVIYVVLVCFG